MAKTNKKKPRANMFTQQRLPSWQPILSPQWVVLCFLIVFFLFTTFGTLLMVASKSVVEHTERYDKVCDNEVGRDEHGGPFCAIDKLSFKLTKKMEQPVYMYYKLTNFYQNHRRYSQSKSDSQLGGNEIGASSAESVCGPIWAYREDGNTDDVQEEEVYNPCGLIAWSMFNDTIDLYKVDSTNGDQWVCSGKYASGAETVMTPDCKKTGIAWSSDKRVKFKAPDSDVKNRMYPKTYMNESGHVIPHHEDEDFMVWMRTAALPSFRKLYRIITVDLEAGDYYFKINSTYPVYQFSGTKSVILSTSTLLGGKNLFLAISYLVVAGLSLLLAIGFCFGGIAQFIIRKVK